MGCPAGFARPLPITQRQFPVYRAASASAAARFKSTDLQQVLSSPFGLVLQLPEELAPRNIRYSLCKAVVLHHPRDVQVFNRQAGDLVFASQPVRQLVQEIIPPVADFLVEFCHLQNRLLPVLAALLFLAHSPLQNLEPLQALPCAVMILDVALSKVRAI